MDRLGEWAKKWQMEYNVERCEVMSFGRKSGGIDYFLNGEMLRKSETHRNLGVIVQDSLKVNGQVQLSVRKANAMLAFIEHRT